MCEVLGVSSSGYYDWRNRGPSERQREDARLTERIHEIFEDSRGTYGSPRIHAQLQDEGVGVGRNRVARLMREAGLRACQPRRSKRTTDSSHGYSVASNTLDRQFESDAPNEVWVADITYVETGEGWLYLAAVIDLYSRKVVGWSMDKRMPSSLCCDALEMAVLRQGGSPGWLHHSDRGTQYASGEYRDLLETHQMECSMSRTGECLDNAVAESFFGTLKTELVHRCRFATRQEAKDAIFEYIEVFYNRKRRHSAIDYKSPVDYETAFAA